MPEIKEVLIGDKNQEKINKEEEKNPLVDLDENREAPVPREVENWLEKIEKEPDENQQNQGDDDSVLQPVHKVQQTVLPISKSTFSNGFNKKVSHAGRWLSEFVLRIIKRKKGKVKFK